MQKKKIFEKLAYRATVFSGSTLAFVLAFFTIITWLLLGPYFNYSDTWQLVINTGTTIITFLMVFLIQRMQNKDSKAMHLKLNELVAALNGPSNRLIDVEGLTEKELDILANYYHTLAEMARKESTLSASHSIEEAVELHKAKYSKKHDR
ncbi:MAG: low affinity iron permease family protein [Sphingobacteriaceae bacterium]|jgi:low affinity Fe/Cu permease|nr:low affinity iron permease family protein [Sphingobacteriaceae bacterium]